VLWTAQAELLEASGMFDLAEDGPGDLLSQATAASSSGARPSRPGWLR
jgi:hypothetical protein